MPTVRIGNATECLQLVPEPGVGAPEVLVATLEVEGVTATRSVVNNYTTGFQDLADFFGGMADAWRGWLDARSWESIEGDLRLEARHEHGRVRLTVTLRHDRAGWTNHGWRVTADLGMEPGEQLAQIARDVAALAAG
nr:DUF6228 family protein [Nocardioides speluncae]